MTVLFLDIRGFTRISEALPPKETFDFLNSYFRTINPVVIRNRGVIDKYIGDAVMALFPERPDDAVQAAVELLAEVDAFNAANASLGRPTIRIGIGAHHGKIMLGTIGSEERMEGTVISETVNLASRLEGMSKYFGVSLVTSREVTDSLRDTSAHRWRPIGRVRAKGSSRTVNVVEVFEGDPPERAQSKAATAWLFEEALLAFERREFTRAREGFESILSHVGDDPVAEFYVRRSRELEERAPPADWDGTLHLEEK
jgi:two-component system sensor histidine kinase ChiS